MESKKSIGLSRPFNYHHLGNDFYINENPVGGF